ncbi:hypothetical protein HZS_6482 [Henneguya salminicola]|nr:hypothetical protein HZS_6482 [Henneguya salminicola]
MQLSILYLCPSQLYSCNADDYFSFFAKFSNGAPFNMTARVSCSKPSGYYSQNLELVGTKGKLILKNDSLELINFHQQPEQAHLMDVNLSSQNIFTFPPVNPDYIDIFMQELKNIFSQGKYNPKKNFIEKFIPFEKGLYLRSIIDTASESSRGGCTVHLNERAFKTNIKSFDSDFGFTIQKLGRTSLTHDKPEKILSLMSNSYEDT